MKNLYDQLKPELLINLLKNDEQYHQSTDRLIKTLKENNFYSDLTMNDVEALGTFCDVDMCYVSTFMYRFGDHLFIKS